MKIVVVAGGISPERDVSLCSGSMIANALLGGGHQVLLMDAWAGMPGVNNFDEAHRQYAKSEYQYTVPETEPDLAALLQQSGGGMLGLGFIEVCKTADVVFLVLHGAMGENGQLQALFDLHGVRYTGSGFEGSCLAMNKSVAKELARFHGIPTPDWLTLSLPQDKDKKLPEEFFPCVVKPFGCGSSVGVSMVDSPKELPAALEYATVFENSVLVEKRVYGREFSVGVLDGKALPVIEIIPKTGFYDYLNKYQAGAALEVCPAELDEQTTHKMQQYALQAHAALRLKEYSRVDFMLDDEGGIFFLEANTLPGMTPTSLFPQEAAAAGISYSDLCETLALLALKKDAL